MNDEEIVSPPNASYFWPILILSISLNLVIGFQAYSVISETVALKAEEKSTAKEVDNLRRTVVPARNVQALLQALANDMLEMSRTDPDIQKIIDKYQIHRSNGTSSQPASK